MNPPPKIDHVSFDVRIQIQMWLQEEVGGWSAWQKVRLPGSNPILLGLCVTKAEAQLIIDANKKLLSGNVIEGTEINVNELRRV